MKGRRLRAAVDGALVDEERAAALWASFSQYMEEHPRDLLGFAKSMGYASAEPALDQEGPLLVLRSEGAQAPYRTAKNQ